MKYSNTYKFAPSDMINVYLSASLNKLTKETWAAIIAWMLSKKNNKWEKFTLIELKTAFLECDFGGIPLTWITPSINRKKFFNDLNTFTENKFLETEEKEETTFFTITDKLIDFYATYQSA